MPATSQAQQRLFAMALQVRKGNMKRSEVNQSVLDIVDGDMTNKQIEDFAATKGLKEHLMESVAQDRYNNNYANKYVPKLDVNQLDKKVFVIVKPGFLKYAKEIIMEFENEGMQLYQTKTKLLLMKEAKRLYAVHKNEEFYNDLCKYMTSGPSEGMTFLFNGEKKDAFKTTDKIKDKIRKKWSESDMRNVMHSSDSFENMNKESQIYF